MKRVIGYCVKQFRSAVIRSGQVLKKSSQKESLCIILILLGSFFLRSHIIHLPGPNPDELLYVFQAERLLMGDQLWCPSITIGNISLPVGLDGYQGAFPIYIHWMLSKLTNYPYRFRIINIFYAIGMMIFVYYFVLSYFGKRPAIFALLFLSTMPSILFFCRIGEIAIFLRVILASALLYFFHKWWVKKPSWSSFYVGCAVLGLGMSTRLEIMWYLPAVVAYLILLNRTLMIEVLSYIWSNKGKMLIGIMWFLMGGSLYILYNVVTGGGIIHQIAENLFVTYGGHSNLDVFNNLIERVKQLMILFNGSDIWGMNEVYKNTLFSFVFGIAFVSLFFVAIAKRFRKKADRKIEFLLFMLVCLLLESTFSVSGINIMHILIIIPIPILIMAKFLDLIPFRYLSTLIVTILLIGNLWVDAKYYHSLSRNGGKGIFSPRACSFVKEIERRKILKVDACDWGLARLVYYFSNGNIKVKEIFGYSQGIPPSFYDNLKIDSGDPNNCFLFYAFPYETFKRRETFLDYLRNQGLQYDEEVFSDKYGPLYVLYKKK